MLLRASTISRASFSSLRVAFLTLNSSGAITALEHSFGAPGHLLDSPSPFDHQPDGVLFFLSFLDLAIPSPFVNMFHFHDMRKLSAFRDQKVPHGGVAASDERRGAADRYIVLRVGSLLGWSSSDCNMDDGRHLPSP